MSSVSSVAILTIQFRKEVRFWLIPILLFRAGWDAISSIGILERQSLRSISERCEVREPTLRVIAMISSKRMVNI